MNSQDDAKIDTISRSSNEKGNSDVLEEQPAHLLSLPPDPDAHLSPEERAAIVRYPLTPPFFTPPILYQLTQTPGSQTTMEARSNPHPLALHPVPPRLPRPN